MPFPARNHRPEGVGVSRSRAAFFPSKAALRGAVDEPVKEVARQALEVRVVDGDVIDDLAERLTALVAENFVALRYVARGVAERDPAAR